MYVFLDFETQSSADLGAVGSYQYANDPTTKVLCVTACLEDGEVKLFTDMQDFRGWLESIPGIFTDTVFVAHNAQFDMEIYNKFVFMTHPNEWYCTMAACRAYGIPASLEKATQYLGLTQTKDTALARRIKVLFRKDVAKPELYQALYEYAIQDTRAMYELFNSIWLMQGPELELWRLDATINRYGICIDVQSATGLVTLVEETLKELEKEFCELSGGFGPNQVLAMKQYLHSEGHKVSGVSKPILSALLLQDNLTAKTRKLIELRQQMGRASVKKIRRIVEATGYDGRLRNLHVYHKAHTGRWAGRGAQPQNLPSRGLVLGGQEAIDQVEPLSMMPYKTASERYGDVLAAVSSVIRPLFKAPQHKTFAVIDFAQIESRVLAWLAGEKQVLDSYVAGEDLYVQMASEIYSTNDVTKEQRSLGKAAILGLGYGMGHAKFQVTADAMFGIKISEDFAKKVVHTYRDKYTSIAGFWKKVDSAFGNACDGKATAFAGKGLRFDGISRFGRQAVGIRLPSGRTILYHNATCVEGERQGWTEMEYDGERNGSTFRSKVYGGLLVENLVQATARDLLANSLLNLQSCGYKTVLHVHDEVVVEIEENKEQEQYAHVLSLVGTKPSWADGLPLEADGFITPRYRK